MKFHCPHCDQHYEGDESFIGQSCTCTSCGKTFCAAPAAPEDEAKAKTQRLDALPVASDMKTCPFCGESIKAVAIKCRYCGSVLNGFEPVDPMKNLIYIILCLLFGLMGLHNFYAKEILFGSLQMTITFIGLVVLSLGGGVIGVLIMGLCGLWCLFDLINGYPIKKLSK